MNKEDSICFAFKKINNLIMRNIKASLALAGFDEVTVMHGWIMGYLYEHHNRKIYQKDIENTFSIAKSTVTNVLKLMEQKGYLTRVTDKEDARLKQISLTPKGIEVHKETIKVIDRLHEVYEQGITEEERECFYRIVDKIKTNIKKESNMEDMS
ncbi:MAG: MarR family winged helix-turn-helix transcriptional regulator [Butyrivibrio sp.]